jgi:hypothetical protein
MNAEIEGRRQDVRPMAKRTTQVYVDDTDRIRFLPQYLHTHPKTYFTHSTTLVTDGRRALLTKEDTGMVWFLGGKQEIAGASSYGDNWI